ncbi:MAG: choline dehydrogenase [Salinisphaeraceae bacterium]
MPANPPDQTFDYLIVGAGSAGCVLADRLSADGRFSVCLLEFGGSDRCPLIRMPAALSIPMGMKRYDWGLYSEPEPGLNGRCLHHARGKVVGGSSSINGMAWVRGSAGDFDDWAARGAIGWDYAHVLPYFRRAEDCLYGDDDYRATGGPVGVCNGNNMANPLYRAFIEAGAQAGYGQTADYNGHRQEGFGRMDMSVRDGERCSTARAYLEPARQRPNLQVIRHALAERILLVDRRATGLVYRRGSRSHRLQARREVILAASAFNSPKLLMLSGIGPAAHLREHGIEVVHDLPGVGANLQDHLEIWVQHACRQPISLNGRLGALSKLGIGARWLLRRDGLGASNQFEANGYIRSRAGLRYPDIQFHFLPGAIAYDGSSAAPGHGFQAHLGPNKPDSRGHVRLRSADPQSAPVLTFNYLQEAADREAFRTGLRLTREIFAQPALDDYRGEELSPGPAVTTNDEIDAWVAQHAETAYHPCSTCRMGTDPQAVVDPACRVHGIANLRVVDSSIMPRLTCGNINAPTIMLAEKAADAILGRSPLAPTDIPVHEPPAWQTRQRASAPERPLAD